MQLPLPQEHEVESVVDEAEIYEKTPDEKSPLEKLLAGEGEKSPFSRGLKLDPMNDPAQMAALAKIVTLMPLIVGTGALAATTGAAASPMGLAFQYMAHSHLAGAAAATQTFGGLSAIKATIPYAAAVSMSLGPSPLAML